MKFRDKSIVLEPTDVTNFTGSADRLDMLVKMLTGNCDAGPLAACAVELRNLATKGYQGIELPKKREKKPDAAPEKPTNGDLPEGDACCDCGEPLTAAEKRASRVVCYKCEPVTK